MPFNRASERIVRPIPLMCFSMAELRAAADDVDLLRSISADSDYEER